MSYQRGIWNGIYSISPAYFGTERSPFYKICINRLKDGECKSILELGPGQGRDSLGFVIEGFDVTGIEISEAACEVLKDKIPGMRVRLGDIKKGFDLNGETFDACYAHMVLIMDMTPDNIRTIMASVGSALKPGGLFMFSVRNKSDPEFGKGLELRENVWFNDMGMPVNYFDEQELRDLCVGFDVIDVIEFEEGSKVLYGFIARKA